jgi:hypothetical protein
MHPKQELTEFLAAYGRLAIDQAFVKTLGITWEVQPEDPEVAIWTPEWCDDCQNWHNHRYTYGWRIEQGELWATLWRFDEDGAEEIYPRQVEDIHEVQRLERALLREAMDAQIAYYAHVEVTGDDPLGEFMDAPWLKKTLAERAAESIATCKGVLARMDADEQAAKHGL